MSSTRFNLGDDWLYVAWVEKNSCMGQQAHLKQRWKCDARRIYWPKKSEQNQTANEFKTWLKCGRPIGSKHKNPRKNQGVEMSNGQAEVMITKEGSPKKTLDMTNK